MKYFARLQGERHQDKRVAVIYYNLGKFEFEPRLLYPTEDAVDTGFYYSYFEVTSFMKFLCIFDSEDEAKSYLESIKGKDDLIREEASKFSQHFKDAFFMCRFEETPEYKREEYPGGIGLQEGYDVAYPTLVTAERNLEKGHAIVEYKTWWVNLLMPEGMDRTKFHKLKVQKLIEDDVFEYEDGIKESHSF